MITKNTAEQTLCDLIKSRNFKYTEWENQKFVCLKYASATEKGNIGEDFLAGLLRGLGFSDVQIVKGRRGPYDVRIQNGGKDIKFEVKVATQDVHGSFQFNGIRYDTQYTHLFCFGISYSTIWYEIISNPTFGSGKKSKKQPSPADGSTKV